MKTLIAYYSRTGENYFNGAIRSIDKGNTEKVAEMIQRLTGADLFEIQQKVPYANDYQQCIEEAKVDLQKNARPALVSLPENLDSYDEIYLGYPMYWSEMPMAVFTFLDAIDWNGKTIHPFDTHEGSGLGRSLSTLKKECSGARITEGLAVHGSEVDQAAKKVAKWVKSHA